MDIDPQVHITIPGSRGVAPVAGHALHEVIEEFAR